MANSINATSTGNGGIITTGDDSGVLNIQTNETTAISIDASQNATFTNGANLPNTFGFKNRIINGGMVIDQRNAGASVTPSTGWVYELDRWATYASQSSKLSVQQVSDAPSNFKNSLKVTSLSAYSIVSGDIFSLKQGIEGFNFYDFNYGTSSAATFTLSFWVKSSLTGTFGGALQNANGDRGYTFTYTINSANTWEYKTVVVVGDTTGTWVGAANTLGLNIIWGLGVGSTYSFASGSWGNLAFANSATGATSVVGTNGATWYITGVQLEKGTQATSFDFRSYGTELALCQRYYEKSYNQSVVPGTAGADGSFTCGGVQTATTTLVIAIGGRWKVEKRTNPTVASYDVNGNLGKCDRSQFGVTGNPNQAFSFTWATESGWIGESSGTATANGIRLHYTASAEL